MIGSKEIQIPGQSVWVRILEHHSMDDSPVPEIAIKKNIFLTHSGIGLQGLRLVSETVPDYPGRRRHFYRYALLVSILRRKINLKGRYLLIHSHWCPGYYHWIAEALPRLLNARKYIGEALLLLPEGFKGVPLESLQPFGIKEIYWIPEKFNLKIEELVVPPNPRYTGEFNFQSMLDIRSLYLDFLVSKKLHTLDMGPLIYISRAKAARRRVINETEVQGLLTGLGFKVVNPEDFGFWEQVSIMFHTRTLVSIHGAGLTNQLFMPPGGQVLELHKQIGIEETFNYMYMKLAFILNHQYRNLFCEAAKPQLGVYEADILVDIEQLRSHIVQLRNDL